MEKNNNFSETKVIAEVVLLYRVAINSKKFKYEEKSAYNCEYYDNQTESGSFPNQ